jgi:hypothetical protein
MIGSEKNRNDAEVTLPDGTGKEELNLALSGRCQHAGLFSAGGDLIRFLRFVQIGFILAAPSSWSPGSRRPAGAAVRPFDPAVFAARAHPQRCAHGFRWPCGGDGGAGAIQKFTQRTHLVTETITAGQQVGQRFVSDHDGGVGAVDAGDQPFQGAVAVRQLL